ncbi:hypothetical protein RxyAA322_28170 [Rubrobacter xylanophilus]|uniref:Uncharacterized protein n=1 Tax=Rubrobacter xylanophilus TaxID=49319 RepID=A0A510HPU5_9ACTN|nr:hypothetical protein RxyAA322_28170 [Rubrobacter xylanophilus]
MRDRTRHRVILVREWDAQVTGSGCCGRLGGQNHELGDPETFAANRCEMEAMGEVYRALRAEFEDLQITVVDPRNAVWLIPAIVRDARRRGLSALETWRQVRSGVSYNAVIFDGKVLFSGRIPAAADAVAAVRSELEELELARV